MLKHVIPILLLVIPLSRANGQMQPSKDGVPVEVVATASEYVPRSTTVSHPGHSYTNCLGSTSYFGQFSSYGDFGHFSGTAETDTHCSTTFTPPTETTLTTYQRVNYTIAKGEKALYLLSCTQRWKPSGTQRAAMVIGAIAGGGAGRRSDIGDGQAQGAGTWSYCPAFGIGAKYTLTVKHTSDARLEGPAVDKPVKLEYLSSAALPASTAAPVAPPQAQAAAASERAVVHITSSPSGGEIYIDGKFVGNTPSDITLAAGEHIVKITVAGKEWSRSIQITTGEISIHADIAEK